MLNPTILVDPQLKASDNKNSEDIFISIEENPTQKLKVFPSQPISSGNPGFIRINIDNGDVSEEKSNSHIIKVVNLETKPNKTKERNRNFDCTICFQTLHIINLMPLDCGHQFCRSCFEKYIQELVSEKRVKKIMCPTAECSHEITEDFIIALSKDLGHSYQRARQFISPNLRRCVGKDCERFLEGAADDPHLYCECGAELCFNCSASWHPGLTCLQALEKDLASDLQKEPVKLCPDCKIRIHKFESCDNVQC